MINSPTSLTAPQLPLPPGVAESGAPAANGSTFASLITQVSQTTPDPYAPKPNTPYAHMARRLREHVVAHQQDGSSGKGSAIPMKASPLPSTLPPLPAKINPAPAPAEPVPAPPTTTDPTVVSASDIPQEGAPSPIKALLASLMSCCACAKGPADAKSSGAMLTDKMDSSKKNLTAPEPPANILKSNVLTASADSAAAGPASTPPYPAQPPPSAPKATAPAGPDGVIVSKRSTGNLPRGPGLHINTGLTPTAPYPDIHSPTHIDPALPDLTYGGMGAGPEPGRNWLLKPLLPADAGKKCLVLDLDETLVHSSFKAVPNADFVIPVEIDSQIHNVYVLKRPGVDEFLQRLGDQFEIVVFTASLAKYADPVLDMLDKHRAVKHRLFRDSCIHHKGNYVKDLSQLGRPLNSVIIVDNSAASYIFHPTNAIPITSWFTDLQDTELLDLIPFLEDLKAVENVVDVLDQSRY